MTYYTEAMVGSPQPKLAIWRRVRWEPLAMLSANIVAWVVLYGVFS